MKTEENINNDPNLKKGKKLGKTKKKERKLNQKSINQKIVSFSEVVKNSQVVKEKDILYKVLTIKFKTTHLIKLA